MTRFDLLTDASEHEKLRVFYGIDTLSGKEDGYAAAGESLPPYPDPHPARMPVPCMLGNHVRIEERRNILWRIRAIAEMWF